MHIHTHAHDCNHVSNRWPCSICVVADILSLLMLQAALAELAELYVETKALNEAYGTNTELVELRNLVTCAELIVSSALQRRESRGLHFCADFPASAAEEVRAALHMEAYLGNTA